MQGLTPPAGGITLAGYGGIGLAASGSAKVVITAICGNGLVTISKFFGWFFTGSPSMLAEAIHSAADTANQILLLIGVRQSARGPTKLFPWGTGQARYVWNLISATGIFFIGFGFTTYHGISSLIHPHHDRSHHPQAFTINMVILLLALIIEGYAFYVAYREIVRQKGKMPLAEFFQRSDDPTTVGVLFEDGIAVVGVFVAFISIAVSKAFGLVAADAIGSIVIGLLMGVMALFLAYVNGRLLLGTSVHSSKERAIRRFIEGLPSVERVEQIRAVTIGAGRVHLAVEIEIHGEKLVNRTQIKSDSEKIRAGEDSLRILIKTAGRMVRVVGNELNSIEKQIKQRFPEVASIELEVN